MYCYIQMCCFSDKLKCSEHCNCRAKFNAVCIAVLHCSGVTCSAVRNFPLQLIPMVELLGCCIRQSQDILNAVSGSHKTYWMLYQAVTRPFECCIRQSQDLLNAVSGSHKTFLMLYQAITRPLRCSIRQSQDLLNAVSGSHKTFWMLYQAVTRPFECCIRQSQDLLNAVSGSHKTSSYTNMVENSDKIITIRAGFVSLMVLIQLSIYIRSYKLRHEVYTSGQFKVLMIEPNSRVSITTGCTLDNREKLGFDSL